MTSISLYGAYEQADEDYARPRFGHPKDRRPDLKQIQTGIGTSADGGIPVFHRAYDGGAARGLAGDRRDDRIERHGRPAPLPAGRRLQTDLLPQRAGHRRREVAFIAPAPKQHVPAACWPPATWARRSRVGYTAATRRRQTCRPARHLAGV